MDDLRCVTDVTFSFLVGVFSNFFTSIIPPYTDITFLEHGSI